MKRIIVSSLSMIFVSTALLASSSNPLDSATENADPCNDGKAEASAPASTDTAKTSKPAGNPIDLLNSSSTSSKK